MAENHILVADSDPRTLEEFRQSLGEAWQLTWVSTGALALDRMRSQPCEVVVAAIDLPEIDGPDLLNQVRRRHPETIRFILASEADREHVVKRVLGAHQVLTKPLDHAALKTTIEHALRVDRWIANNRIRDLASRVRSFPTIPALYLEVLNLLRSPSATTEEVGAIIAKDMAMVSKLLQVINSACFGLPRRVTDPAEAVGIMGFETVKSMVMSVKFLSQYNKLKPGYFSIDRLWRHSTDVARIARELVLLDTNDRALASDAFTAGLLHDLGKVVLAANFDEQYSGAHSLARKQQIPLWEIEKAIFGASHGEIGAYLFGLWGMPLPILEAAALHHEPSRCRTREFAPLTALHVANVLENEFHADEEGLAGPRFDTDYLAQVGCLERLPIWRQTFLARGDTTHHLRKARIPAENTKKATVAVTAAAAPAPVSPVPQTPMNKPSNPSPAINAAPSTPKPAAPTPAAPAPPAPPLSPWAFYMNLFRSQPWVVGGAAALVLLLAALLLDAVLPRSPEQVKARTLDKTSRTAYARRMLLDRPGAADSANYASAPGTAVSNATSAASSTLPAGQQPAAVQQNAHTASTVPKEPAFAELRLYGVFYTPAHPTALINGRLLGLGEQIGDATVLEIGRTNVILARANERKTLTLR